MSSLSIRVLAGLSAVALATTAFASAAAADDTEAMAVAGAAGMLHHRDHGGRDHKDPKVVATGLNNPRHLTVASNGDVYITETGSGGADCADVGDPIVTVCAGASGAITLLPRKGEQRRVVTGLPSMMSPEGDFAGASDIAVKGKTLMVTIGLGASPTVRDALTEEHGDFYGGLASVQQVKLSSHKGKGHHKKPRAPRVSTAADLAQFETDENPLEPVLDTNPNAIVADGKGWLLADAGGNDILRLDKRGNLHLIAVLPNVMVEAPPFMELPPGTQIPMEAVPTSLERGPDGAIYVSQLTGFPFPTGGSSIWRIARNGSVTQWATGLTNVTDMTFGDDGELYAVQIADDGLTSETSLTDGSLLRVGPGAGNSEVIATDLFAAYGVAVYKDYAYVTTGSVTPAGEVMRFDIGD